MTVRMKVAAVLTAAGVVLALPVGAQAKSHAKRARSQTKTVYMGLPAKYSKTFQNAGGDVNDFFPHGITIHVGDKVRFLEQGFHTLDFPPRGQGTIALVAPTGQKVTGVNDESGQPFWFNGLDNFGFNPALAATTFGKKFTYSSSKRIESGAPITVQGQPKPITVKFKKAGRFTFFCDIHPGMKGFVRVVGKKAKVPSKKADKKALKNQVKRDLNVVKALPATKVPAGVIYVGVGGPHGEEFYGFSPSTISVPVGTTLRFTMSPSSLETHTATTGPGNPGDPSQSNTYLGKLAASFNSPVFDPRAVYPSEKPGTTADLTPTLHGNGFWNAGAMDNSTATPLGNANAVRFAAPGTYTFYCLIHTFMHATVTVTP